ncbi:hypothetical protein TARUN_9598 [Trichoderma arundinaceum]|uniref:Uncharacterized protein n=1 Tax=Trichoderma arundinaceum TaxID=490622 RepID=A0A395N9S4_TRIAR|nr:hypothetical protein TARUN_9598 [Trichoderma arundinaceum]
MSFSRNRRLRRSFIEPIQTADLSYRWRPSPLAGAIPPEIDAIDSVVSTILGGAQDEVLSSERQTLRKLRIPDTTFDAAGLLTPLGTLWTTSRQLHPTPVSAFSPCRRVLPFVIEARSTGGPNAPREQNDISVATAAETLRSSFSSDIPAKYRPPNYRPHLHQVQCPRLDLWEQGPRKFGRLEDADVFVKPLQLRRSRREIRSWSDGPETPSSASPSSRRLCVRAVIRSKTHLPIGLKREFDLDALRATIPDPLPSPRSPNFNQEALLSKLEQSGGEQSTDPPAEPALADVSHDEDGDNDGSDDGNSEGHDGSEERAEEMITSPSVKWQRFSSKAIAVPIRERPLPPRLYPSGQN